MDKDCNQRLPSSLTGTPADHKLWPDPCLVLIQPNFSHLSSSSVACSPTSPTNEAMAVPPLSAIPPPPGIKRKLHQSLRHTSSSSSSPFIAAAKAGGRRSLRRTDSVIRRKVTWTKERKRKSSSPGGSHDEFVEMLKLYPYHFSISGSAIPHRHQIDSPTTLCFHLVKLVVLVTGFTAIIFLIHCLMYLLYSMIYNLVTSASTAGNNSPSLYLEHPRYC
uniref:Uncharacterized protein n=1 Tax=Ditylenchus dipsaci TaxID=166011 RepID=A0A915DCE2_9BILA